jgi:hypothetical protein
MRRSWIWLGRGCRWRNGDGGCAVAARLWSSVGACCARVRDAVDPNTVEASNGLSIAAAVLQILAMLYGAVGHYILRRRAQLGEVVLVVAPVPRESETVGWSIAGSRDNRKAKRRRLDLQRNNNQQADTLLLLSGRAVVAERSIDVALALRKVIEIICERTSVVGVDTM